jgi:phosphate starvation-inducible protein PhoH
MIWSPEEARGLYREVIEIAPCFFYARPYFGDAVVILDEGQNTTINQLKMF